MKRHWFVFLLAALFLFGGQAAAQTTITFSTQSGDLNNPRNVGTLAALEQFQKDHPDIKVQLLPGTNNDRLIALVAAGTPPDLAEMGIGGVLSNGAAGVLTPLEHHIERAGLDTSLIVPGALRQVQWRGSTYAVPWTLDVNFVLGRNRALLSEAGIDPDVRIPYIADFDAILPKVTRIDGDGTVSQVGYSPVLGSSSTGGNEYQTWARAFGGDFYDPETEKFTLTHPANVRALEWMVETQAPYGLDFNGLRALFPGRMSSGKLAFNLMWPTRVYTDLNLNPDLDLALTPAPYVEGIGHPNPVWVSGPTLVIPTGATANIDVAMQLMKYLTVDPEGSTIFNRAMGGIPAARSPVLEELRADPVLGVFVEAASTALFGRPPVPTWRGTGGAVGPVMNGEMPALPALQEVERIHQLELDEFLAGL